MKKTKRTRIIAIVIVLAVFVGFIIHCNNLNSKNNQLTNDLTLQSLNLAAAQSDQQ